MVIVEVSYGGDLFIICRRVSPQYVKAVKE